MISNVTSKTDGAAPECFSDAGAALTAHYRSFALGFGLAALAAVLYGLGAAFWAGALASPALGAFLFASWAAQEYDDALGRDALAARRGAAGGG